MFIEKALAIIIAAAAMGSMASASDAEKRSTAGVVKNVAGKVWIDNVGGLQWGEGHENSFIFSLTTALNAMGEKLTYDYVMGVSGAAFRVQFMLPEGCPSSPDATCGFNCSITASKALGYPLTLISACEDQPEEVKKVREAVVKNIDSGRAVLGIDLINIPDWGIIMGYTNDGKDFLCRTYYNKSSSFSIAEKWPWSVVVIGEKGTAPAPKQNVIESLKIAQKLAETDKFDNYASGFAAFDAWIKLLKNESSFTKLDANKEQQATHMNAWRYASLIDCRSAAARYLLSVGNEFCPAAAEHLVKASDLYQQEVKLLKDGQSNAPFNWQLKEGEHWTQEMRDAEAITLKNASDIERKAIDELKEALKAEKA